MAYTNKYNLPDNSRTREILIRRHQSIRRSIRAGSFREQVGFISTLERCSTRPPTPTCLTPLFLLCPA